MIPAMGHAACQLVLHAPAPLDYNSKYVPLLGPAGFLEQTGKYV